MRRSRKISSLELGGFQSGFSASAPRAIFDAEEEKLQKGSESSAHYTLTFYVPRWCVWVSWVMTMMMTMMM